MAHDVFISYSAKNKTIADAVCATLESHGIRCWIAPRDVVPGMEWGECIIEAIEQARIMVLIFTADANASPQIRREVERAVNHGVAILPLRIENVMPGRALEYFIGNVHWLDALTPPLEAHLQSLAGTIKMLLARAEPVVVTAESAPAPADDSGRGPVPASEGGSPSFGPEKAASEGRSAASSPRRKKSRIPRVWLLAIFGGAAVLIVLLAVFIKHREAPWAVRISGTTHILNSIFGTSDGQHLWVVGEGGTIVESDDGGATWTAGNSDAKNALNSICGTTDGKRLWAVGNSGMVIETDDEGANWTARKSGITKNLGSIFGTSDGKRLWAVGEVGTIVESGDGGATWRTLNSGIEVTLSSIFGTGDGKRLWAVGGAGTILESDDGGATWTARNSWTTRALGSITGTGDGKRLWAVGDSGTIVESADGGATWTARNGGTASDLHSIFGTSDGQHLWVVGEGGTILESDDGGASWKSRNSDARLYLYSIFGTSDGKRLWAVGDRGTILESEHRAPVMPPAASASPCALRRRDPRNPQAGSGYRSRASRRTGGRCRRS